MPSNITAYEWPLNGTTHIAYETGDNHIHEIAAGQDERWRDDDITRGAGGAELEDAIMTGYTWPDGRTRQKAHASSIRNNGHINELVMLQDHPLMYENLRDNAAGAPSAVGFR